MELIQSLERFFGNATTLNEYRESIGLRPVKGGDKMTYEGLRGLLSLEVE